jgi:hypothetical protein
MQALVVYESMYGNTHEVADAIAEGLRSHYDVEVVAVGDADPSAVASADLLVVGGPTHAHGLSTHQTRESAVDALRKEALLKLDTAATGPGLRDWFKGLCGDCRAAAFDTRFDASPVLTGRAGRGIRRRLAHHGFAVVVEPESFVVDRHNRLRPGERARAIRWGAYLADAGANGERAAA